VTLDAELEQSLFGLVSWFSIGAKVVNGFALVILLRDGFARLFAEKETLKTDLKYSNAIVEGKLKELGLKSELDEERLLQRNEFVDLGILTASVEHELRNPLSSIFSIIELMKAENQSDDRLVKHLESLDKERRSMLAATDIVNTLRSSRDDLIDKMRDIDVEAFINRVIKNIKREFGERINQIYLKVDKQKEELFVRGFPFLLEKVFINFTKNSIESILSKSDKGVITFDLNVQVVVDMDGNREEVKDKVTISITDNGPGFLDQEGALISDEDIGRIVHATYSTKSAADSKANRGIGLFVCDRIVRMHKAKMIFENLETGGAKVSITLDRYFTHQMRKKDRPQYED